MKRTLTLSIIITSVLLAGKAAAQSPGLQEQLEAHYPVTDLDKTPIVPGAVLMVQTADLSGVHSPREDDPITTYRNGVLAGTQVTVRANRPNDIASLSKGERVYVRNIAVNPQQNWVALSIIQCGGCMGPPPPDALRSIVRFEFSPGEVQASNLTAIEDSIGKVLNTHVPAETAGSAPPQPPLTPEQAKIRDMIQAATKSPAPPGVYTVGGDVTPPMPIYRPDPPMTAKARRAGLSGNLVFLVIVDSHGYVTDLKQVSPTLGLGLDESATATVRTWKFKPAIRNGVAVSVRVLVEISFRLFSRQ
jgi:TonB family protein